MTLTPDGYRPRLADNVIESMLATRRAVVVEGPRSCGKTWTALSHAESAVAFDDTPDGMRNRALAELDPRTAIRGDAPRLVDFKRDLPRIRRTVFDMVEGGLMVTLPSSIPDDAIPNRIGTVRMRTMSLYESGDSDGDVSLSDLFDGPPESDGLKDVELERLAELVVRGGWPGNIGIGIDRAIINNQRHLGECLREAAELDGRLRDRRRMDTVLKTLARYESTTVPAMRIHGECEGTLSDRALAQYLEAFRRAFVTDDQPSFDPGFRTDVRVRRGAKRHLADPSLAASILGETPEKLMYDIRVFERLFEAMCERDLDIYARSFGGRLGHYRDQGGHTIDAVVEMPDGRWGALDIRLGFGQADEAAEDLLDVSGYISERSDNPPAFLCVICGVSSMAYQRSDGVYVVPITSMRP